MDLSMTQATCEGMRVRRDSGVVAKPPPLEDVWFEYVVAFTSDYSDCIICPKAYLVEQDVTALHSRKPYPHVQTFMATSSGEAMALGMKILRENREEVRPV